MDWILGVWRQVRPVFTVVRGPCTYQEPLRCQDSDRDTSLNHGVFFGMQVAVVLQISQCYTSGLTHSGLDFRGFSRGEFCAWHASKVRGSFNPPCHKNTKIRAFIFFQQQAVSSAVSTHPEMTSLPKFTCKIPSACLSESSQACKYQHGLQATQVAMVALLDLSRTFFCKPLIEQKHQLILDGRLACYPRLKAQRCEQMTWTYDGF